MIKIGEKGSFTKTIGEKDVQDFSEISGDKNPLHLDEGYAENTIFGGRIAHGMIGAGIISAAIAMVLPGQGTIYLSQTLDFQNPVRIGDQVTANIKVVKIEPKKKFDIATLETICVNQNNEIVIRGNAVVIPPR